MSNLGSFLLVWSHALGRSMRGKRLLALLLLAGMPVLFAVAQVAVKSSLDESAFLGTVLFATFQFLSPLASLFLGVAVLGDEIDGRTITYVFSRPIPRPIFYLARLLGFTSALCLVVAVSLAATASIFLQRVDLTLGEIFGSIGIALLGVTVYTAFFAALRLLVRRALLVGFLLVFVVEVWVSKLPVSGLSRCSVWHHLTLLEAELFDWRGLPSGILQGFAESETVTGSISVLVSIFVVALGYGCYLVQTREIRVPAAVA